MATQPPSTTFLLSRLILRLISLAGMVFALGLLSSISITVEVSCSDQVKISFKDIHAYRYMLSIASLGAAYTIIQIGLTVLRISLGPSSSSNSDPPAFFNFFGNKIASYLLVTGAAAGFVVTKDLQRTSDISILGLDRFFDKAYASAGLVLLRFICAGLLFVAASSNLPKIA